jgi:hypothetical protein
VFFSEFAAIVEEFNSGITGGIPLVILGAAKSELRIESFRKLPEGCCVEGPGIFMNNVGVSRDWKWRELLLPI